MFSNTDLISSYTREEAINDLVLQDIKPPMMENTILKAYLGHNGSIVATDTLFNSLNEISHGSVSIVDNIISMGRGMVSEVLKQREKSHLPSGNMITFEAVFVLEKATIKRTIKCGTHIEPKFFGQENVKCLTFMMENES